MKKKALAIASGDRSFHSETGFSLIELLMVLLLLALISGMVAPATGTLLEGAAFRSEIRDILAAFRYARLKAISTGQPLAMAWDERENTLFLLEQNASPHSLWTDEQGHTTIQMTPERVRFFPEGTATPARMVILRGGRRNHFRLDPLSGLPFPEAGEGP